MCLEEALSRCLHRMRSSLACLIIKSVYDLIRQVGMCCSVTYSWSGNERCVHSCDRNALTQPDALHNNTHEALRTKWYACKPFYMPLTGRRRCESAHKPIVYAEQGQW